MTNTAHTPVALDEEALVEALESARHNTGDIGKEIAIRAYLSAVGGEPVTDSLWVTAKPEHSKIGWTYDFDQTERLSRAAEAATGYDAVMEVVEFVMAEADRRHKSELARIKAQPGVVKAAQDAVAELANVPMQLSLEDWSRISNAILAALAAPVSQEPVAWRVKDFADGWIIYQHEGVAKAAANGMGARLEPLYPSPQPTEGEPSDAEVVKALEWNQGYASVMFGGGYLVTYCAGMKEPAKLETRGWWDGEPNGYFKTVDEAKAAAQADYERRILSALAAKSKGGQAGG